MEDKIKRLNFGCGTDLIKGFDNVDIQKAKQVINFDFNKSPYPLKSNTYDYVFTKNVLEHLESPEEVLLELWRICKYDAWIDVSVPYYNNKGAYSDMQHKHYFSDTTFKIFVEQTDTINKKSKFEILSLELTPTIIGKFIPRYLREKLSLFIGGLIADVKVRLRVLK